MIATGTALDPNQVLIAASAVLVALVGLIGVMLQQGRRIRSVDRKTDQLQRNGGDTLLDVGYATKGSVDSIRKDVATLLDNQTEAIRSGLTLLQQIAELRQTQNAHLNRTDQLERAVDALRSEMANLRVQFAQDHSPPISGPVPVTPPTT